MSYLAARSSKKDRLAAVRSVDGVVMVAVWMIGRCVYSEVGWLFYIGFCLRIQIVIENCQRRMQGSTSSYVAGTA